MAMNNAQKIYYFNNTPLSQDLRLVCIEWNFSMFFLIPFYSVSSGNSKKEDFNDKRSYGLVIQRDTRDFVCVC
jgi:hypothetical protein